eukprot:TRINITY_DN223_c0_g1_i1.p1 TRINITY_DN223_c0_g1~~TRINITY_DN223_c0_g1_i1.p1  ORF type:complete len:474 (+),score=154.44 TRINITY_DN223_c0_g1_i1:134-1555(+)
MSTIVIKVFYGKEAHRISFPADKVGFEDLKKKIASRIKKDSQFFTLKYEDQENDRVTLTCDDDIRDAILVANELKASCLKIYVSESSDPVDNEEFVLLQSESKQAEEAVPEPVVSIASSSSEVSFEQLNEDFQRMLDNRVNAPLVKPSEISLKLETPAAESVAVAVSTRQASTNAPFVVQGRAAEESPVVNVASPVQVVVEEVKVQGVSVVHEAVTCDGCEMSPIQGVRFKCIVCENYDLCSDCEAKNVHEVSHPLLKIKVPRSGETVGQGVRFHRRGHKFRRFFAKFVSDETIPDRSSCAPGETKFKVWKLQNVGQMDWPAGLKAVCISGEEVIDVASREVSLPAVPAGAEFDVKVQVNVPKVPGRYVANFKLVNPDGEKFGPKVWVDFYVPEIEIKKPVVVEEVKAEPAKPEPVKLVEQVKSAEEVRYKVQLEELASMGFSDASLNVYLLDKFEGKVERVVHWLLDRARSN